MARNKSANLFFLAFNNYVFYHFRKLGGSQVPAMSSEAEILNEAKMLREHKERLESRMKILEEHNSQLCGQLGKLKQYLQEVNRNSENWV